jgi:hypothetical protein
MRFLVCLLGLAWLALASGCSTETLRRTAYETLQNVGQQECEKSMSSDCQKRVSYDEYQRERKELKR